MARVSRQNEMDYWERNSRLMASEPVLTVDSVGTLPAAYSWLELKHHP